MKNLFKLLTSVVLTLILTSTSLAETDIPESPEPQPSDLLMGRWISENILYNRGVELHTEFNFTNSTMTLTGSCVFPAPHGTTLTATLSSQIEFNGNDLYILETKNSLVDDGYRYCKVYVQPTRWQFYFNGLGKAVLIAPVPYGAQFSLVRPN